MGLLEMPTNQQSNILTEHGFTLEKSNVIGTLQCCYERILDFGLYRAWVSVVTATGDVCIYVDYDCGGEVERHTTVLTAKWLESHDDFFKELDDYVSDMLASYISEITIAD